MITCVRSELCFYVEWNMRDNDRIYNIDPVSLHTTASRMKYVEILPTPSPPPDAGIMNCRRLLLAVVRLFHTRKPRLSINRFRLIEHPFCWPAYRVDKPRLIPTCCGGCAVGRRLGERCAAAMREALHARAREQLRNAIIALADHLRLWQYGCGPGFVRFRRVICYPNVFLYSRRQDCVLCHSTCLNRRSARFQRNKATPFSSTSSPSPSMPEGIIPFVGACGGGGDSSRMRTRKQCLSIPCASCVNRNDLYNVIVCVSQIGNDKKHEETFLLSRCCAQMSSKLGWGVQECRGDQFA